MISTNKTRYVVLILSALIALSTTSCATNQSTGSLVGGILGGALGSQIGKGNGRYVAIVAGTLAGALIGGSVGNAMDDVDRMKAQQALENVPTNKTSSWQNPDTGNSYSIQPLRTFQTATGPCREYVTQAKIGAEQQQLYGTACRQADGAWKAS